MSERHLAPRRLRRGLAVVGALALAAGLAGLSSGSASATTTHAAQNAKHHKPQPHGRFGVVPMRSASTASTASRVHTFAPQAGGTGGPLNYGGGPVQHNVQVYLVFWGSQWDSDSNGVQSYMQNLFSGLGTGSDSWSTVTSQYTDSSGAGPTFNGAVLAGTWVDDGSAAPQSAAQSDIAAEAENGVSHFGITPSGDTQIVVLSPSGTNPDGFPNSGFCAWHDYDGNVSYTNMPYVLDAGSGCGANSVASQLDGFSIVEGHEYAESLTDPQPSSGYTASDGEENGDLCAWYNLGTISLDSGTFAMQPTWSNAVNGCAMSG
jgi:serine protease